MVFGAPERENHAGENFGGARLTNQRHRVFGRSRGQGVGDRSEVRVERLLVESELLAVAAASCDARRYLDMISRKWDNALLRLSKFVEDAR